MADQIIEFIQKNHPNIAIGTVYKTLEILLIKHYQNQRKWKNK